MIALTPDLILKAYACGIFPMAEGKDENDVFWVDPEWRGVIPLDEFHVPRRLARTIRNGGFAVRIDHDFEGVLRGCSARTKRRPESWINGPIAEAYAALHELGYAHSVETWREGELVGGLYGVSIGAAFFGESMFSEVRDASKVALAHLVGRLQAGSYRLLDTQFVTAHLSQFGAVEIPRGTYLEKLSDALRARATFYPSGFRCGTGVSDGAATQSRTQMS